MPIYVFLDTNNWIYLANGYNIYSSKHEDLHLKVFETIERWEAEGRLIFLINEIILEEFERNKLHTEAKIVDIEKKSLAYIGNLKPMREFLDDSDVGQLNFIEQRIKEKAKTRIDQQREHILRVEQFLKESTVLIPVTDHHRIEATRMAMEKKAPFIGEKKNSTADALLMLGFVDYMKNIATSKVDFSVFGDEEVFAVQNFPLSYFVSSNSGDFSDPNNREELHSDLVPLMNRSNSKFYYVLHKLINDVEKELLTVEEEELMEDAEDWASCEVCENEFSYIEFFKPISLFDPHLVKGGSQDQNQLGLYTEIGSPVEKPYVEVVVGECNTCGTSYLVCPNCEDLVVIDAFNVKIDCPGCHYKYILHQEIDRKGYVDHREFEISMTLKCEGCGEEVDAINEEGLCEVCEGYEKNQIMN